ncbi:hypothetical protein JXA05_04615 [Candidatus Peregrinibacteria bacterium]|nr:hypothetical protein [Candidatus Peregrinibacteria bacterium]
MSAEKRKNTARKAPASKAKGSPEKQLAEAHKIVSENRDSIKVVLVAAVAALAIIAVGTLMRPEGAGGLPSRPYEPPTGMVASAKELVGKYSKSLEVHEGSGNLVKTWLLNAIPADEPLVEVTAGRQKIVLREGFAAKYGPWYRHMESLGCQPLVTEDLRTQTHQGKLFIRHLFGGGKATGPTSSRHLVGSAVDISRKCQNGKTPYAITKNWRGKNTILFVEDEKEVKKLLAEQYADEMAQLSGTPGYTREAYLDWRYKTVKKEAEAGLYGAYDIGMESAYENGLVGGFCGIRDDYVHFQEGETDCRRGSPRWEKAVRGIRRAIWKNANGPSWKHKK